MTTSKRLEIIGAGGGGGGGDTHTPVEAPDSLRSVATARILDLLCEGPIEGVVGGPKGVYLDDVPLQKPNSDEFNFKVSAISFRNGEISQTAIEGIPSAESEVAVAVEITKSGGPIVRTVTTAGLDALRVTVGVPGLQVINSANGDINGASVEFQVEVQPNGESYQTIDLAGNGVITGKTSSRYQRTVEFKLPGSAPWNIRITRLTDDHSSSIYTDKTYWDSYTEVQFEKLTYPGSALVGLEFDASQFKNIPSRAYLTRMLRVLVPSNYNPVTRVYSGTWDGTFIESWTDNPAWCLYDLLTDPDHGLGSYIDASQVDKWALYEIAQYCDESVDDGKGGTEPRFTCNLLLQRREDAWKVVQDMCSIFRGLSYWVAGTIQPVQDSPQDPVALFTPSNVIEGKFAYSGTSRMSRHNAVLVAWNDPADRYKQKTELVKLDTDVAARGLRQTEIVALGCTSQGQAHRVGRWLLYTELYETETVVFRTGLEGAVIRPGDIIAVQDDYRAPSVGAGRVATTPTSTTSFTLDSSVTLAPATSYKVRVFTGNETTPYEEKAITTPAGTVSSITVDSAFSTPPVDGAAYQILEASGTPSTYRILSISEQAPNIFEITALSYDSDKYTFVESNLDLQEPPGGNDLPSDILAPPANLGITEYLYISGEAVKDRMHIYWDKVTNAQSYFGQWRKDNGSWVDFTTSEQAFDVLDVNPGLYEARVCGVSQAGSKGLFSRKSTTLVGKAAPPADVANFKATGGETTVELTWDSVADLDLSHYVIKEGDSWADGTEIWKGKGTKFTWQKAPVTGIKVWIKAEDTSGNQSTTATQATIGGGATPADDDYIYPLQKPAYITEWARIGSEKAELDARAATAGVSATAFDAAYTALDAYLTDTPGYIYNSGGTDYPVAGWNVAPGVAVYLGPGGRATAVTGWNARWGAYYAGRDALLNSIVQVATDDDYITPAEKPGIKARRDRLAYEYADLIARAAEAGANSASYEYAISALTTYLNSLTSAGGWSSSTNDWADYTTTYSLVGAGGGTVMEGKFSDAEEARDALSNAIRAVLSNPNIITKSLKIVFKKQYDTNLASESALVARASEAGVSSSAYTSAIDAMESYMDSLTGTYGWSSDDWSEYDHAYDLTTVGSTRSALQAIYSAVETQREALRSLIEQVLTNPDYVAPAEKPTLKGRYDSVLAEQVTLDADADSAGVSRVNYDAAVAALTAFVVTSKNVFGSMTAYTYLGSGGRTTMEGLFKTCADEKKKLESAVETGRIAALPQDTYRLAKLWDWTYNDSAGWTTNGSVSDYTSGTYRRLRGSGSVYIDSAQITEAITGKQGCVLIMRLKVNSVGTWDGRLQFKSNTIGAFSDSYMEDLAGPTVGVWKEIAWDMRELTAGSYAYVDSSQISYLRIYLCSAGALDVDIDWIALGQYGAGSKSDYDAAVAAAATTAMQKADFLDGGKIIGTTIKDGSILTPQLGANVIFAGNLFVADLVNLVPNGNSQTPAPSGGWPTGALEAVGLSTANPYRGSSHRRRTSTDLVISGPIAIVSGEVYSYMAYVYGTGTLAYQLSTDGGVTWGATTTPTAVNAGGTFSHTGSSYGNTGSIFRPSDAGTSYTHFRAVLTGSGTTDYDDIYLRRANNATLQVDGDITASAIAAGAIQTYHLNVGPLIEFKSSALTTAAILKGSSDGTYSRFSSSELTAQGKAENTSDAAWYVDPVRIFPSSGCDSNLYEFNVGAASAYASRGILINMAAPYPTGSAGGLFIHHSYGTIYVKRVSAVGAYTSVASVAVSTATANDKLTVVYYNTAGTSAATRLQVYLNGSLVLTCSDTTLGSGYNGAKAGYAGVWLEDTTIKVWGLKFGKGSVVIQDGIITGDKFVSDLSVSNVMRSPNYAVGTTSAAPTGFKLSGTAYATTFIGDATTSNVQMEIGSDVNIAGYKAAKLTNNAIGGSYTITTTGSTQTFNIPEGVTLLRAIVVGAGGGGGGANNSVNGGGGGGGAGAYLELELDVTGLTTLSIDVGAGGAGGSGGASATDGSAGGLTKIFTGSSNYAVCYGGGGGKAPTSGTNGDGGDGGRFIIYRPAGTAIIDRSPDSTWLGRGMAGAKGTSPATMGAAEGAKMSILWGFISRAATGSGGGGGGPNGVSATGAYAGTGGGYLVAGSNENLGAYAGGQWHSTYSGTAGGSGGTSAYGTVNLYGVGGIGGGYGAWSGGASDGQQGSIYGSGGGGGGGTNGNGAAGRNGVVVIKW